jgi:proline-specific peptidase
LLVLHGGPGMGHDYLEPLSGLRADRPVVFFDQLGCGKSEHPDDPSLWRIDRIVAQIDAVRRALRLDYVNLLGHSGGGWFAIEYMLGRPQGIAALILAGTSASIAQFASEARRLKATLPAAVVAALDKSAANGDFEGPEYAAGLTEFFRWFGCRIDPWPEALVRSLTNWQSSRAPREMLGPDFFCPSGNLRNWDRLERLNEISVPTLITCGRFDEMGPVCAATLHDGIAGSELAVFEQSSHVPHLEETARYLEVVRDFLARTDRRVKGRRERRQARRAN